MDNQTAPSVLRVTIKQSKMDPFRKGVDLFLGKTGTDLCPVVVILNYMIVRGREGGALFRWPAVNLGTMCSSHQRGTAGSRGGWGSAYD